MAIQLNNAVYTLLASYTGLTAIVGTNVFPIIAPNETPLPFIVIERDFTTNYTKDYVSMNDSNVEITILSTNYNQGVQISALVDNILNNYKGSTSGINIRDCRLINCTETYQDDAFIQKLIYAVKNN